MRAVADEIVARLAALPAASTPVLRDLRREYSRRLASASARDLLDLAAALLAAPSNHAQRFLAYELVAMHRAARQALNATSLDWLASGMADWGAVDMFGTLLSGPAWRAGLISDNVVAGWARSPNRWWRRAALVSTTRLQDDSARTLSIATLLVDDRDDMVVKAMSWALRELSKRDPQAVRAFLASHQLAPRVVREVNSKLTTGLKNPRGLTARRTRSPQGPA